MGGRDRTATRWGGNTGDAAAPSASEKGRGRLALRLGHKSRPNEGEQLLSSGSVAARRKENYNADLFGLSSAALDEDTNIGTVSIQPVLR